MLLFLVYVNLGFPDTHNAFGHFSLHFVTGLPSQKTFANLLTFFSRKEIKGFDESIPGFFSI